MMFSAPRLGNFLKKSAGLRHLCLVVAFLSIQMGPPNNGTNYLHTSGNRILDASGNVVGLSGINWFGLETEVRAPHGLWQRNWQEMLDQVRDLGYNVIRLPFANAILVPGTKPTGINYAENPDLVNLTALEVMDRIIAGARARNLRVILDNHRSTAGGGPESNGLWYTDRFPESRWIDDWKMLANRYKDNDAVIAMDLRNEPWGACWGCGDPTKDWRLAAEKAGNAILSVNPNLLIIVEGVANYNGQNTWWGGNLMGAGQFPVRLQVPNRLVYSAHEYPGSMYAHPWFRDPSYPNNLPGVWDRYWGYLATDTPILIGEFGTRFETDQDKQWLQTFTSYIRARHLHWTFWSLNPNSGDTGGLLLDNWTSVHPEKQALLKAIQYPLIGSSSPPAPGTSVPGLAPQATSTPSSPRVSLYIDNFESVTIPRWQVFHSSNAHVLARTVSPGQSGNYALRVEYGIDPGGWGGVERTYSSPENWKSYSSIAFSFYGTNSGSTIRFELLDNRAPGSNSDTAERFEYKFTDNFNGWKAFRLSWNQLLRRSDWQPQGAPDDGLSLRAVWGFNFSPVQGNGSFQIDEIRLVSP